MVVQTVSKPTKREPSTPWVVNLGHPIHAFGCTSDLMHGDAIPRAYTQVRGRPSALCDHTGRDIMSNRLLYKVHHCDIQEGMYHFLTILPALPTTIDDGELPRWHEPSPYQGGRPTNLQQGTTGHHNLDPTALSKLSEEASRLVWRFGLGLRLNGDERPHGWRPQDPQPEPVCSINPTTNTVDLRMAEELRPQRSDFTYGDGDITNRSTQFWQSDKPAFAVAIPAEKRLRNADWYGIRHGRPQPWDRSDHINRLVKLYSDKAEQDRHWRRTTVPPDPKRMIGWGRYVLPESHSGPGNDAASSTKSQSSSAVSSIDHSLLTNINELP